jgi:hypothetical protein
MTDPPEGTAWRTTIMDPALTQRVAELLGCEPGLVDGILHDVDLPPELDRLDAHALARALGPTVWARNEWPT